jgi:hypothetical protein
MFDTEKPDFKIVAPTTGNVVPIICVGKFEEVE